MPFEVSKTLQNPASKRRREIIIQQTLRQSSAPTPARSKNNYAPVIVPASRTMQKKNPTLTSAEQVWQYKQPALAPEPPPQLIKRKPTPTHPPNHKHSYINLMYNLFITQAHLILERLWNLNLVILWAVRNTLRYLWGSRIFRFSLGAIGLVLLSNYANTFESSAEISFFIQNPIFNNPFHQLVPHVFPTTQNETPNTASIKNPITHRELHKCNKRYIKIPSAKQDPFGRLQYLYARLGCPLINSSSLIQIVRDLKIAKTYFDQAYELHSSSKAEGPFKIAAEGSKDRSYSIDETINQIDNFLQARRTSLSGKELHDLIARLKSSDDGERSLIYGEYIHLAQGKLHNLLVQANETKRKLITVEKEIELWKLQISNNVNAMNYMQIQATQSGHSPVREPSYLVQMRNTNVDDDKDCKQKYFDDLRRSLAESEVGDETSNKLKIISSWNGSNAAIAKRRQKIGLRRQLPELEELSKEFAGREREVHLVINLVQEIFTLDDIPKTCEGVQEKVNEKTDNQLSMGQL